MKLNHEISIKVQVDESEKKLKRIQLAIMRVNIAMEKLNLTLKECNEITINFSIIENKKKWYQFWK